MALISLPLVARFAGALLVVCMSGVVLPTEAHADWEFVGASTTTARARDGFMALHEACQADFGDESRACFSDEVMESPGITEMSGGGWVLPRFAGFYPLSSPNDIVAVDSSGVRTNIENMTCGSALNLHIVFIADTSRFQFAGCDGNFSVTCCQHVGSTVVPAMSGIGPTGRALMVALMILAVGAYGLWQQRPRDTA